MSRIWNSLRWRIFAYYTTLLAVAIGLVLALGYRNETRHLSQLGAARMQNMGLGVLPSIFPPPTGPGGNQRPMRIERPELVRQFEQIYKSGAFIVALNASGTKVFTSPNLPTGFTPPPKAPATLDGRAIENAGFLVTELRTRPGDRLILGMPMRIIHDESGKSLVVSLAIGAGIFLILAAIGGLMVFGGLRPVARMSGDARRIANGDLSARLDTASQCEELRGLGEVLNQTFDRLSEALQRQVRFTADASHELRTPLAAILADCEFALHKERTTERYLETIEVCQESAQHMGKLVERLGLLARLDSDETALEIETFDLADAARRAISWVEPLAREHAVTLHSELHEVRAAADPLRIGQVLLNLLRNAVVYNHSGGSVTIRNGMNDSLVWFEVEDTGQGIPKEKIERVFERFFRADESRNFRTGGAGLGLAICKAIMEAHGGGINVRSEFGVGTTFRVEWPVEPSDSGNFPRD